MASPTLARLNKQVWRLVSASLFLVFFAGCSPSPEIPTALPTVQILQASATATSTSAEITPSPIRTDIETYTVVQSDTISSIAETFKLKPETVLWANYDQLLDDPDFLLPGMQLTILPIDGTYHQIGGTDTVQSIAAFFAADAQAIIDWPGNEIDPSNPVIFVGQWVLVPGGQRALRRRFAPNLYRYSMAVDPTEYGVGACPENVSDDTSGDGVFAWPVDNPEVDGDGFWSAHPGLDLAVEIGGEVRAADAGVVTFSGWSNLGYGYMIMLDHGNGNFSLYAGLNSVIAICGSAVGQGDVIGTGGMSGHPAEPFVHFEIRRGEEFLNPLDIIPRPNNQ
ncbi:MAG: LysM peptidoglycan-binding domain-containing M23 family metallopeptidase [Chloroflexi bacterium]|nr:LysM peptidoglycan-binding domain-containing M23 family metallopeptidase [Chloroflexota bacterium]